MNFQVLGSQSSFDWLCRPRQCQADYRNRQDVDNHRPQSLQWWCCCSGAEATWTGLTITQQHTVTCSTPSRYTLLLFYYQEFIPTLLFLIVNMDGSQNGRQRLYLKKMLEVFSSNFSYNPADVSRSLQLICGQSLAKDQLRRNCLQLLCQSDMFVEL